MKDHIRRDATHYTDAIWWLVPIAFAVAALAAVAVSTSDLNDVPRARVQHAVVTPPVPVRPVPATPTSVRASQPEPPEVVVTEHIQAF